MRKLFFALAAVAAATMLASCSENGTDNPIVDDKDVADMVVFGNIYTSEEKALNASAFAVKDGKYIYVGDSTTATRYIREGVTRVLNVPRSQMVMAGCTEGHGHYITEAAFRKGLFIELDAPDCEGYKRLIKQYRDKTDLKKTKSIVGFGWYEAAFKPEQLEVMADMLDSIFGNIPVFISDHEMHQAWVSSELLRRAGITENKDTSLVDKKSVPGGTIYWKKNRDGKVVPTGRIQDQACGYVRLKGLKDEPMLDRAGYADAVDDAQQKLLSMGYTNYLDAWLSYDNTPMAYEAIRNLDDEGRMNFNMVGCYEIDSYKIPVIDSLTAYAEEAKLWNQRYGGGHFRADHVKLFADGCTESGHGFIFGTYPFSGSHGDNNWDISLFGKVVAALNHDNLVVHTHCYGDAAVNYVVGSYIDSELANGKNLRNSLGHAANVQADDFDRISKHGIGVAENFCWHSNPALGEDDIWLRPIMDQIFGTKLWDTMYPMKSFFDHQIPVASSTDAPCSAGFPVDPFGIVYMMMTGVNPMNPTAPRSPEECTSLRQALQAMTINGAWLLGLEKERGSIAVGKFADFLILSKNICNAIDTPVREIADTKVLETYFEGKSVYRLKN